jgi:ABC-type bacteriocin/lantibiotic exporter with double-glycine peptidase domain
MPVLWLDVPFVQQEKNGCGAASIAMVMQYWQHQESGPATADAPEIQRALYSRRAHGIYASDMERFFQQHGFRTFAIHGEWSDLEHNLENGRPLIVALRSGRDVHYVVVTGMDRQQEIVLKHDPARRRLLKQARSDFEREWKAADNWTLLAVPDRDPASAR